MTPAVTFTGSVVLPDGTRLPAAGTASVQDLRVGIAINAYPNSGHTRSGEYNAHLAACGQPDYVRCYLNQANSTLTTFPTSWPVGGPTGEFSDWASRGTYLSAKPNLGQFVAGQYDAKVRQLVDAYHGTGLDFTIFHEVEDDVESGAVDLAQWQDAVAHAVGLFASIGRPDVHLWVTLMGYTFEAASKRDPEDYWIPGVYGYGVDTYNVASARHDNTAWKTPAQLMDTFTAWANTKKVAKGWIECGCAPDFANLQRRADFVTAAAGYCRAHGYARLSYFDSTGPKADWCVRSVVKRTAYYPAPLGSVTSTAVDNPSTVAWRAVLTG